MKTAVFDYVRKLNTNLVSTTRDTNNSIIRNQENYNTIIDSTNKTTKEKGDIGEKFVIEIFKEYFEDITKNKHINQGDLISEKYKLIVEVKNYTNNNSVNPETYLKFVRDCIETPKYFHIFLDLSNTNNIETFFIYDFKLLFVNIDDLTKEYMNKIKNTIIINNKFTSYIKSNIDINKYNNIFMLSNVVMDHINEVNTNKIESAITKTFDKVLIDHCNKVKITLDDVVNKMSKSYKELYKVSSYFGDVECLKQRIYNNMFGTKYYEDVIPINFKDDYDPNINTQQQLDKFVSDNIDKLKDITWTKHKFETYIYKRKIIDKDFRAIMNKYKKQQSRKDSCYHGDSKQLFDISVDDYKPNTHNDAVYTYQLNDSFIKDDNVKQPSKNESENLINDNIFKDQETLSDIYEIYDNVNNVSKINDDEQQSNNEHIIKLQEYRLTRINDAKYKAIIYEYKQNEVRKLYETVVYKSDIEFIEKCLHNKENIIVNKGITNAEFVDYCNENSTEFKYKYEREKCKNKERINRRIQDLISLFDVYEKYTKNCFRTLLHKSTYYDIQCIKRQNVSDNKKDELYNTIYNSLEDYLEIASKYNREQNFPILRRLNNCKNIPKEIIDFNKEHGITDMCRSLEEFNDRFSHDTEEYKNIENILQKYKLRVPGEYNNETKINNFLDAIKDCLENNIPFAEKTFDTSGNKQCSVYNIVLYVVKYNHMENKDKLEKRGEIYYKNNEVNKYIESVRKIAIEKGLDKNKSNKSCYPQQYYK